MRTETLLILALALSACGPSPQATAPPAAPAPETAPEASASIQVTSPQPGARVTSPISVTGVAPGTWYFEAVFDAKLLGADGRVIAQAPARAQSDWMTTGPVPFVADLPFEATNEEGATIVLTEDQSGDQPNPRQVRIPVVLRPR